MKPPGNRGSARRARARLLQARRRYIHDLEDLRASGWTLQEIADELEVSRQAVSATLSGGVAREHPAKARQVQG